MGFAIILQIQEATPSPFGSSISKNERAASGTGIAIASQYLLDRLIVDHTVQSVAAEQHRVAVFESEQQESYRDGLRESQGTSDDVAVLERRDFLSAKFPSFEHVVHQRVVTRELAKLIAPNKYARPSPTFAIRS
jgi:hypothetical protein